MDALRVTSNFYLALYFTTFFSLSIGLNEKFVEDIGLIPSWLAVVACFPVIAANMLVEPHLSLLYSIMCTMYNTRPGNKI